MGTIPKASALYVFRPETSYTCGECAFLKSDKGKHGCAFFGPAFSVSPMMGACGYYSHAEPGQFEVPWMGIFTPVELGYAENRNGFSCGRCEYFGVGKNDCSKVDRNSPGDTPGEINPRGCCSLWDGDKKRGRLNDEQLEQALSAKPMVPQLQKIAGRTNP